MIDQLQFTPEDTLAYFGGLDQLVSTLGIADSSSEMQMIIVSKFMELVFKRMLLHVPKEKSAALSSIIEGGDGDALLHILKEHIPDFEKTFQEEIARTVLEFSPK